MQLRWHFRTLACQMTRWLHPDCKAQLTPTCICMSELRVGYLPQVQADSTRHVGQMDFSDVYAGEDTPQSITLSLTTGQLTLTREQLRTLSWTSHTAVWKVRLDITHWSGFIVQMVLTFAIFAACSADILLACMATQGAVSVEANHELLHPGYPFISVVSALH